MNVTAYKNKWPWQDYLIKFEHLYEFEWYEMCNNPWYPTGVCIRLDNWVMHDDIGKQIDLRNLPTSVLVQIIHILEQDIDALDVND